MAKSYEPYCFMFYAGHHLSTSYTPVTIIFTHEEAIPHKYTVASFLLVGSFHHRAYAMYDILHSQTMLLLH